MAKPLLEEVFKVSGVPTYTYVKPVEYQRLLVALRTPGRGLVVEGPSGIGKTTSVLKVLEELSLRANALMLTSRKEDDLEVIRELPYLGDIGTVIVDDFHRLERGTKEELADLMKVFADEETPNSKLVLVGINKAGDTLVRFARDLNNRIDTIRFEANPLDRIEELIGKGEKALNIALSAKDGIAEEAHGSFHIAQMLCREACTYSGVTEKVEETKTVGVSLGVVRQRVFEELNRLYFDLAFRFAKGPKMHREGRAPYLHLLYWLAMSNEWSLQLDQALAQNPSHKNSVGQVVQKEYLDNHLRKNPDFADVIHYDPHTRILSVEDPKFVYYIRNVLWNKFAAQVGFINIQFGDAYDFALSFAGADRSLARALAKQLASFEVEVFFDENEVHKMLAEDIAEYLGPIYETEATYVVVLLGPEYPKRVWTQFESDKFRARFGEGSVIPIWFSNASTGTFDESSRVGGLFYNVEKDLNTQVKLICQKLIGKLREHRVQMSSS